MVGDPEKVGWMEVIKRNKKDFIADASFWIPNHENISKE
jgi:hypothetical protein